MTKPGARRQIKYGLCDFLRSADAAQWLSEMMLVKFFGEIVNGDKVVRV